jgi:hypothetical protein
VRRRAVHHPYPDVVSRAAWRSESASYPSYGSPLLLSPGGGSSRARLDTAS